MSELERARELLVQELREYALVLGDGHADERRAGRVLRRRQARDPAPGGLRRARRLVAAQVAEWEGTAVGGMTMGADPVACAALAGGAQAKAFFVSKDAKAHGLQRRIEGPPLGPEDSCVVVEDVVTTGGSTLAAIAALQEAGLEICGVISVLDRLAAVAQRSSARPRAPVRGAEHDRRGLPDRPDRKTG